MKVRGSRGLRVGARLYCVCVCLCVCVWVWVWVWVWVCGCGCGCGWVCGWVGGWGVCALPCPALPALPCCPAAQVVRWKPMLFVELPACAARAHNPTPIHLSSAWLCNVFVYVPYSERKQRARKPPLRGVWG